VKGLHYRMLVDQAPRYMLEVRDYDRSAKGEVFAVYFEPPFDARTHIDLRAAQHDRAEYELWSGIKMASPGTYLEAKDRGWVPESVTKVVARLAGHDRGPAT
jgi:hypothetical protein